MTGRPLFPRPGDRWGTGYGEGHPEDRCDICPHVVQDHTWAHPWVMLRHAISVLIGV